MADGSGDSFLIASVIVVVAIAALLGGSVVMRRLRAGRVIVFEGFAGLLMSKGLVKQALSPGQYSTAFTNDTIEIFDLREQSLQAAGQEVLCKDLLPVRISLTVRWKIVDPKQYRAAHVNSLGLIYEEIHTELRRRVAAMTLEELLADREKIMAGFTETADVMARSVGATVAATSLRDLTLEGPARSAYADIWKAKKEGEAALERARGEQAALRSLANAARMLKGNPELMNLRLLQALNAGPGKAAPTVVLGGGAGLLPVQAGEASADAGEAP